MYSDKLFSQSNITACEKYIISLQRQMDKAVDESRYKEVHRIFDLLTRQSQAVKIVAINRVTRLNNGKYTAGIDGIATPRDSREASNFKRKLLKEVDICMKPTAIRRVFIPKSNNRLRPLGIPTINDRVIQSIIKIGLEPIAEYNFHPNSHGFRPKRSCQDAMVHLYKKLSNPNSPRYVVEGDIKGCFDNISHGNILRTLNFWGVPLWALEIIQRMLKTGIMLENKIYTNEAGTPQGGIISPLLANVALTGLDYFCLNFAMNVVNPIVRYADDFVITCKSEKEGETIKAEIKDYLSETSNLTLSDEKTAITHITKGFDFLGFNFRKYKPNGTYGNWTKEKLLIKPQPEKVVNFLREISKLIRKLNNADQNALLAILNPKLRGFAMYYRHCVSQTTFNKIDFALWQKLLKWGKRKHRKLSTKQVIKLYFHSETTQKATRFMDKNTGNKIYLLNKIPIRRFNKVRENYRIFDGSKDTVKYWENRDLENSLYALINSKHRNILKRQKGICSHCKRPITLSEILQSEIHIHHVIPKKQGGDNKASNLILIHKYCHAEIHKSSTESPLLLT